MKKDHAEYLTDEQIAADVAQLKKDIDAGKISEDEAERDAYFNDPANADEIDAMFARMELVEAMYKARHEAGLTQKEIADRLGTKQAYIAALERGRKNVTFSTLARYAAACGKKVAVTLL
ncbi:MAG: helix-turn-helix domain-containing protein [Oscillospiraceae bacterium]|nr:helix-turn-helix domain-containing protein [Oscillospiraceae bacterium]